MGFFVDPPLARKQPLPDFVGPITRLGVCTASSWSTVVFCACKHGQVSCSWGIEGQQATSQLPPEQLDECGGWYFIRFVIANVQVTPASQDIVYTISHGNGQTSGRIQVPGSQQEWNLVAYSCYDQRRGIGEALWADLSAKAKSGSRVVHAILGGGDQLYNDNIWALAELDEWLHKPREERLAFQPDKKMCDAVERAYMESYLGHTHFHPAAEFLRCTPQVNTWDDHDTFDGWGSYPPEIQNCAVFSMVFRQSQRFYLLFQHATSPAVAAGDGYLVEPADERTGRLAAYHFASQLGPSAAVVAPDSRSQRSKERIIPAASFKRMGAALRSMAPTTQHLIFLSAIPVIYPALGVLESLLVSFEGVRKGGMTEAILNKTGLYDKIYNDFGQPDLLDDVTDHWSSGPHEKEKAEMLTFFYQLAKERQWRVTVVSGDVHLGAYAYLSGPGKKPPPQALDPAFMPQIVTSGIGNKPPEDFVVKYVDSCGKKPVKVTPELTQHMGTLFQSIKTRTGSAALNNRMNHVELGVKTVGSKGARGLEFKFVFLGGHHITGTTVGDVVGAVIPPLLKAGDPQAAALEMEGTKAKRRTCGCCGF